MAYTKIIPINTNLSRAINYITNPDKTNEKVLVGTINCRIDKAYRQMQDVKSHYGKRDGRLGYHLIQSFKHNEIDENKAYKIAEQYATQYLGDKYQVVFATHIDKEHIHNHILWNSVSIIDGMKYHADKNEYQDNIRRISDEICKENNLSIIVPNVENTINMHYAEWIANKKGHPTWRKMIRADVDDAMEFSSDIFEFYTDLEMKGYKVNTQNKYLSVICKGMKRPIRLKSLGEKYTSEIIKQTVYKNRPTINEKIEYLREQTSYAKQKYAKPPSQYKGWLVIHWWYKEYSKQLQRGKMLDARLRSFPRADIINHFKMQQLNSFVFKYKINDQSTLNLLTEKIENDITVRTNNRDDIRKEISKTKDETLLNELRPKLNKETKDIRTLRKELKIAEAIPCTTAQIMRTVKRINPRLLKEQQIKNKYRGRER